MSEPTTLISFDIPIQFAIHVTKENIDDIMSAALDVIGYWCDKVDIVENEYLGSCASDQVARGGHLKMFHEDTYSVLDIKNFIDGLTKFYSQGYDRYHSLQSDHTIDTCNIDGEMADVMIQLALFGELVYG